MTPPSMPNARLAGEFGEGRVVERVADRRLVQAVAGQGIKNGAKPAPGQARRSAAWPEQVPEVLPAVNGKIAFDLGAVPG